MQKVILILLVGLLWCGNAYAECIEGDCKNGQGTKIYDDGDRYVGEWKNSKTYGQGTYTYVNGDKYVGEWKNNKQHGQGTYTWASGEFAGNKHVGEFKNGKEHGQGTHTWASGQFAGDKYVGGYKKGNIDGQGTYTYADGTVEVGIYKKGKLVKKISEDTSAKKKIELTSKIDNGQGTVTYADGSKYVGEFTDGKKHGQGTYTYTNGDKYVGEFKNDKQHGQGTYTYANGEKYVGEFKNGKFHGQGTVTYADGTVNVVIFKKDKLVKILSSDTSAKKKIEMASMIDDAKNTCKDLGFKEGTEKFSDCSLKLYSQSVELAAKSNQQVVGTSSGGSVTIYDPVRDSGALMKQGQRMLSGACTLGINC